MHVYVGNVIHIMCTLGYAVALLYGALNAALSECTAAVVSQRPPEGNGVARDEGSIGCAWLFISGSRNVDMQRTSIP